LLLVEDSAPEVHIMQRALRESGRAVDLHVVRDGQEAMEFLCRQGRFVQAKAPMPDLILLDLNLPRLSGLEVLARMRGHAALRSIPVVVWTTSRRPEDIAQVYAAGANSYLEKPGDYQRFREVLDVVLRYWFDTALLPPQGGAPGEGA
jgi:CheY-like chemotaxis protein